MDLTEVRQNGGAPAPTHPDEEALRAWDWKAALEADERAVPWLAARTSRAVRTVYGYSRGELVPPIEWLREAAAVLGGPAAATAEGA